MEIFVFSLNTLILRRYEKNPFSHINPINSVIYLKTHRKNPFSFFTNPHFPTASLVSNIKNSVG
jgi:hypothetical protein